MTERAGREGAVRPGPVRVMHLMFRLHAGGMEYGVLKLVNGLDRSCVQSSICSTRPAQAIKELLSPAVPLFECRRREGNDPTLVWQLYRLFRRERPDIVHTHAWGTLCEGLIAGRLARVPVIIHGEHGTLQTRRYQLWVQRWAWSRVDQVLSVSSRLADRIAGQVGFPVGRIRTIRNGVNLSRFSGRDREDARRSLGLDPRTVVIGAVGRLVDVKDHTTLLKALGELRQRGGEFLALIAGDGPLRPLLEEEIAALGLGDSVRLLGHRADVDRVLAALDIFVLPSKSEGLSNTILEAMATGLPVVATRVGGADELVDDGHTGLLVPPQAVAPLVEALGALAGDPARRATMGGAGRARAEQEFTLDAMVRKYERLYLELAGRLPDSSFSPGRFRRAPSV